ncbi:hypothetical protein KIW84_075262 [Lathyrus oleraceus]|uniref:Phospholipid/glycerol acyltransferase domain-containing protein n=1 Tax=Pisum sativum TaxID=3888 RepID=A0A9D4VVZ8_PEA|nr:hypothetical protein KIW84_075262 [Pisum sativum]
MGKEHALVISNHESDIDWLVGWTIVERSGCLGSTLAEMKKSSKFLPVIGWSMRTVEPHSSTESRKNPKSNPEIKTIFTDHSCSVSNRVRASTLVNLPAAAVARPSSFVPLGVHCKRVHFAYQRTHPWIELENYYPVSTSHKGPLFLTCTKKATLILNKTSPRGSFEPRHLEPSLRLPWN